MDFWCVWLYSHTYIILCAPLHANQRYGNSTTIDTARINICGASRNYNANCSAATTAFFNSAILGLSTECQNLFLQQAAGQQVPLMSLCPCYMAIPANTASQIDCRPYNGLGNIPVDEAYDICANNVGAWSSAPTVSPTIAPSARPTWAPTMSTANPGASSSSSSSGGGMLMYVVIVIVVAIIAIAVIVVVMKKKGGGGGGAVDPREAFQNPM